MVHCERVLGVTPPKWSCSIAVWEGIKIFRSLSPIEHLATVTRPDFTNPLNRMKRIELL